MADYTFQNPNNLPKSSGSCRKPRSRPKPILPRRELDNLVRRIALLERRIKVKASPRRDDGRDLGQVLYALPDAKSYKTEKDLDKPIAYDMHNTLFASWEDDPRIGHSLSSDGSSDDNNSGHRRRDSAPGYVHGQERAHPRTAAVAPLTRRVDHVGTRPTSAPATRARRGRRVRAVSARLYSSPLQRAVDDSGVYVHRGEHYAARPHNHSSSGTHRTRRITAPSGRPSGPFSYDLRSGRRILLSEAEKAAQDRKRNLEARGHIMALSQMQFGELDRESGIPAGLSAGGVDKNGGAGAGLGQHRREPAMSRPTQPAYPGSSTAKSVQSWLQRMQNRRAGEGTGLSAGPTPIMHRAYSSLEPLDVVFSIEHCHSCQRHNVSLRHNAEEFVLNADAFLRTLAQVAHSSCLCVRLGVARVFADVLPSRSSSSSSSSESASSRLGAFEIQMAFRTRDGELCVELLHSKLASKRWPSRSVLERRLRVQLSQLTQQARLHRYSEAGTYFPPAGAEAETDSDSGSAGGGAWGASVCPRGHCSWLELSIADPSWSFGPSESTGRGGRRGGEGGGMVNADGCLSEVLWLYDARRLMPILLESGDAGATEDDIEKDSERGSERGSEAGTGTGAGDVAGAAAITASELAPGVELLVGGVAFAPGCIERHFLRGSIMEQSSAAPDLLHDQQGGGGEGQSRQQLLVQLKYHDEPLVVSPEQCIVAERVLGAFSPSFPSVRAALRARPAGSQHTPPELSTLLQLAHSERLVSWAREGPNSQQRGSPLLLSRRSCFHQIRALCWAVERIGAAKGLRLFFHAASKTPVDLQLCYSEPVLDWLCATFARDGKVDVTALEQNVLPSEASFLPVAAGGPPARDLHALSDGPSPGAFVVPAAMNLASAACAASVMARDIPSARPSLEQQSQASAKRDQAAAAAAAATTTTSSSSSLSIPSASVSEPAPASAPEDPSSAALISALPLSTPDSSVTAVAPVAAPTTTQPLDSNRTDSNATSELAQATPTQATVSSSAVVAAEGASTAAAGAAAVVEQTAAGLVSGLLEAGISAATGDGERSLLLKDCSFVFGADQLLHPPCRFVAVLSLLSSHGAGPSLKDPSLDAADGVSTLWTVTSGLSERMQCSAGEKLEWVLDEHRTFPSNPSPRELILQCSVFVHNKQHHADGGLGQAQLFGSAPVSVEQLRRGAAISCHKEDYLTVSASLLAADRVVGAFSVRSRSVNRGSANGFVRNEIPEVGAELKVQKSALKAVNVVAVDEGVRATHLARLGLACTNSPAFESHGQATIDLDSGGAKPTDPILSAPVTISSELLADERAQREGERVSVSASAASEVSSSPSPAASSAVAQERLVTSEAVKQHRVGFATIDERRDSQQPRKNGDKESSAVSTVKDADMEIVFQDKDIGISSIVIEGEVLQHSSYDSIQVLFRVDGQRRVADVCLSRERGSKRRSYSLSWGELYVKGEVLRSQDATVTLAVSDLTLAASDARLPCDEAPEPLLHTVRIPMRELCSSTFELTRAVTLPSLVGAAGSRSEVRITICGYAHEAAAQRTNRIKSMRPQDLRAVQFEPLDDDLLSHDADDDDMLAAMQMSSNNLAHIPKLSPSISRQSIQEEQGTDQASSRAGEARRDSEDSKRSELEGNLFPKASLLNLLR